MDSLSKDWKKLINTPDLPPIVETILRGGINDICPPIQKIFEFANVTPLDKIRVVLIG